VISTLRRNTELGLIVLCLLITAGAYALTSLGLASADSPASLPATVGPFLGFLFVLLVVAHLATRKLARGADGIVLPLAALLNGVGYVLISRLDEDLAGLQATWTAVGIVAFVATLFFVRRTRDLQRYRYTFMVLGLVLLLLPLLPGIGRSINGARIWASIGPVNFQPGEFAKIALAIFFAGYLVERREVLGMATWPRFAQVLPDPKHLGPVILAWAVSLVVMTAERDLGSSLLFFALFILLLWVGTGRGAYLGVGLGLFAIGSWLSYATFSHVEQRVSIWLDPWQDYQGDGYQVIQSWFAMAWGGIGGTGLGLGNPEQIPVAETDFIFAAVAEELGLLGATAIVVTFLLLVGCGLRIAVRAEAPFDKLLAAGLTVLLGVQAFIIMAGVTRLLPLTGVTLPFVSYGGSSLVANYVLLALLMRVSADSVDRVEERTPTPR
jgi:cell division protein FtsW (lipid II flippase)